MVAWCKQDENREEPKKVLQNGCPIYGISRLVDRGLS
jgi:hypothetical protein